MKNEGLALLFTALVLGGCLSGFLPQPATPTPAATPAPTELATSTPLPTPLVTVTEKIVYVTVTPTPRPTVEAVKGGLTVLEEYFVNTPADLSSVANADYHSNPFVSRVTSGGFYQELEADTLAWKKVPLVIPKDFAESGKWNVITTTDPEFYTARVPMKSQYYSKVFVAYAGRYGDRVNRTLADIILHYGDATSEKVALVSGQNAWNYNGLPPENALLWRNGNGSETLSILEINASKPMTQLVSVGIRKTNVGEDGIAVFAVTGQRALERKRLTLTPGELADKQYNREYAGVDSQGVHLTFREQEGRIVYVAQGTFFTPIFDGETFLVDYSKISWDEERPPYTSIKVEARVGPRPEIDRDWTDWFEVANNKPLAFHARYVTFRFTLTTKDETLTPVLKQFRMEYVNPA